MRIDLFTLFPGMFRGPFDESIVRRARERDLVHLYIHDIRAYTHDRHHVTDDYPYGGGPGMVMKPEPLFAAVEAVRGQDPQEGPVILLTPQGSLFSHETAVRLATERRLSLICGRYEGVDERVREHLVTEEISIGDYVLSGGELAAMVVVEAVVRQLPGVLGSEESLTDESFRDGLLEYPQYTRPAEFRGWRVPEVLLSGNHGEIARWRQRQRLLRTAIRRPELLARARLRDEDRRFLESRTGEG